MLGIISHSSVRPPPLPIDEGERQKLKDQVEAMGLLE